MEPTPPSTGIKRPAVALEDWGLIPYGEAWSRQRAYLDEEVARKLRNRKEGTADPANHRLIRCEHPHVYTLGRNGNAENMLLSPERCASVGAEYYEVERGGDITYHGPGQLVVYPIIDLEAFFTDIHRYMRYLEEAVIRTLAEYGIVAGRVEGMTGVWVEPEDTLRQRKICAMGVKASRWVTMHGLALNVEPDLTYFTYIVPCGLEGKPVTSMAKELGRSVSLREVGDKLQGHLAELFGMRLF